MNGYTPSLTIRKIHINFHHIFIATPIFQLTLSKATKKLKKPNKKVSIADPTANPNIWIATKNFNIRP